MNPKSQTGPRWIFTDASAFGLISDLSSIIGSQNDHKIITAGDLNKLIWFMVKIEPYIGNRDMTLLLRGLKYWGYLLLGSRHLKAGGRLNPGLMELPKREQKRA